MNAAPHSPEIPILTVVTVTFNLCKAGRIETLRECINSVKQQTCASQIEHLIIDGASQDGTLDFIAEFEEKGWVTCYSEPDTGIYNAMNKGIARAKGKYIVFMNSDDYFHDTDAVEKSIELLEKTGAAFSYGKVKWVFDGRRPDTDELVPNIGQFFISMPFCHQSMIARTEVLKHYSGFDEGYRIAADHDLVTRLLLGGERAVYLPKLIACCSFGGISTDQEFAVLYLNERLKLRRKYYAPYIGEEGADDLDVGIIHPDLAPILASFVHPSLVPFVTHVCHPSLKQSKRPMKKMYRLFGFLPVFLIKTRENSWGCSLFGCLSVLKSKTKQDVQKIRLFGFIPLLTLKTKGRITLIKILSLIPILRIKTSTN